MSTTAADDTVGLTDEPAVTARASTLLDLGRRLLEQGDVADAVLALRRRLRLAPTDIEARYLLGHALLLAGEVDAAAAEVHGVLGRREVDPDLCLDLATALHQDGKPAEAYRWARIALDARPGSVAARQLLAELEPPAGLGGLGGRKRGRHVLRRR